MRPRMTGSRLRDARGYSREAFAPEARPTLEMRVHTKSRPAGSDLPNDPAYPGYSLRLMARLFIAWIAMLCFVGELRAALPLST